MVRIYGIPNCNTVKKTLDYFKTNNIAIDFHDYKKKGVSAEKIEEWISYFGLDKVVNKAGTTYRKLSEAEKAALEDAVSAVAVLQTHTSVIKRPVVELPEQKLIGFNEEYYKSLKF